jgi:E3 ubiquitin-protein ligase BRE1
MRDKEASENERKNIARNIEKQAKALERLVASEKSFSSQVVRVFHLTLAYLSLTNVNISQADLEREVALLNKAQTLHRDRISVLEGEVSEWKGHASYEKSRVDQVHWVLHAVNLELMVVVH